MIWSTARRCEIYTISSRKHRLRRELIWLRFYQGRCLILEVDGQHHSEEGQTIRDYARDRVLLRSGVPTVRFTAKDCMIRPEEVVAEFLSILMQN